MDRELHQTSPRTADYNNNWLILHESRAPLCRKYLLEFSNSQCLFLAYSAMLVNCFIYLFLYIPMEKESGTLEPSDSCLRAIMKQLVSLKRVCMHILRQNILKKHYSEFINLKNVDFYKIWPLYCIIPHNYLCKFSFYTIQIIFSLNKSEPIPL